MKIAMIAGWLGISWNHLKVDSAPLDPGTGIIYFVASGEGIFHCGSRVQARRGGLAVSNLDGQSSTKTREKEHQSISLPTLKVK